MLCEQDWNQAVKYQVVWQKGTVANVKRVPHAAG
jgi:hypothetical protein